MFNKKTVCAVVMAALLPWSAVAEEEQNVDCDEQFEVCIEKCEGSSDELCERKCDEAYNACLEKQQSEE